MPLGSEWPVKLDLLYLGAWALLLVVVVLIVRFIRQ